MISFKILCLGKYSSESQKDLKNEKTTQEKVFIFVNNNKQKNPIKMINVRSEDKCKKSDIQKRKNMT